MLSLLIVPERCTEALARRRSTGSEQTYVSGSTIINVLARSCSDTILIIGALVRQQLYFRHSPGCCRGGWLSQ